MTKKHFKVIAEAIYQSVNHFELVDNLCREFKKINPLFNEPKFRVACGGFGHGLNPEL